jgi:hypothetical protein
LIPLVLPEWSRLSPSSIVKHCFYRLCHASQIKIRCIVAISQERGR